MATKSLSHLFFWEGMEFFHFSGDIYCAPIGNSIEVNGYRCGRWECPYSPYFLGALKEILHYRESEEGVIGQKTGK